MKKYNELIKNVGLLTLSNFGTKLLSFFLIPLYTSVLTTEEYGNFDLISVTVQLLFPILTLNISEAALRFLLENKNNKEEICNISFKVTAISVILFLIIIFINRIFNIINVFNNYIIFFIMYFIMYNLYQLAQCITRGFDKIKNIAISGFINSILILGLNILFLLVLKMGLEGYFLANIIANLISSIYLFIVIRVNKYLKFKKYDRNLEKKMLTYSKPLVINSIGWWINNVSDRYIITYMCGVAENGVYSVSYKIPTILATIQSIFNQAWTISAIKNFNKDDNDNFFKNVYSLYNFGMVICCSILILLTKVLANIFFMNEFYNGWRYVPFLLVSSVFGALSGILGGIFSATKDSKILGYTTLCGALINIFLNIIMIFQIGVLGAAIATAISSAMVWGIRIIKLKKTMNIGLKIIRDLIAYMLLIIQSIIILRVEDNILMYIVETIILIVLIVIFKNEIKKLIDKFKSKFIRRYE